MRGLRSAWTFLHQHGLATGHEVESFVCTHDHPFYVDGKGFVPAGKLAIGNAIVTRAGPDLAVSQIEFHVRPEGYAVYNLVVEADHSYFVGEGEAAAWVHNGIEDCVRPLYRGGSDLTPKPGELKVRDGMVQPTRGVSLHTDPAKMARFGGAHRVDSIPDGLEVVQQGRDPGHFGIATEV